MAQKWIRCEHCGNTSSRLVCDGCGALNVIWQILVERNQRGDRPDEMFNACNDACRLKIVEAAQKSGRRVLAMSTGRDLSSGGWMIHDEPQLPQKVELDER